MQHPLLSVQTEGASLTALHERTRQLADLFALEPLRRTRLVTAVSELARHAAQQGGDASVAFLLDTDSPHCRHPTLLARITGQADPAAIASARHLVDHVVVNSREPGAAHVALEMALPRETALPSLAQVDASVAELLQRQPPGAMEELEQRNRELLQALEQMRQQQVALQQADLRKNEFLAILAHELRNPLATLNMTLAILRRKTTITPEEVAQRSEVMTRQIGHLVRLVDDLTAVTQVDRGKVEFQDAPVEINSLIKDTLEMTAAAIQQRRHSVVFKPTPDDVWVKGDAARLLQVVGNVIQNANRYTPEGGLIEVQVRTVDAQALIEVTDNGAGIDAEMLPQVFGMFVQARARSTDGNAGPGVGLTLADRLVRAHGGSISVKSEGPGCGSQFTITLPLMLKADASCAAA